MLKKLFLTLLIVISLLFLASTLKLNKNDKPNAKSIFDKLVFLDNLNVNISNASKITKEDKKEENDIVGKLIIKKLNINNNLYNITSKRNNVDENITILNNSITPKNESSIMFIAGHSGTGKKAFFKDLDKLQKGDEIILIYDNVTYYYEVKNFWEEKKDGDISVLKEDKKQLILTTCSPSHDDMQLVVNCIEK